METLVWVKRRKASSHRAVDEDNEHVDGKGSSAMMGWHQTDNDTKRLRGVGAIDWGKANADGERKIGRA